MGGFEVTVENAVTMPKMNVLVGFDGVPEICWKKTNKEKVSKNSIRLLSHIQDIRGRHYW
jgi:hypothetical protein